MAKSPHLSRNEFVKVVVGAVGTLIGAVIALPAVGYLLTPAMDSLKTKSGETWIPVGPLENFEIGKPQLFNFTRTKVNGWERTTNSYGIYIFRQNEAETLVFSNVCTHLSCRVTWRDDSQDYFCPCHDGLFSKEGAVIGGPPDDPLISYSTKVEEGTLYFNFLEG